MFKHENSIRQRRRDKKVTWSQSSWPRCQPGHDNRLILTHPWLRAEFEDKAITSWRAITMDVVSWAEKSMWNSVANRSVELFVSVGRGCVIMRSTLKINFYSVRDGKSWNANTKSTHSENCHQSWRDSHSRGGRGKYVVVATLLFKFRRKLLKIKLLSI